MVTILSPAEAGRRIASTWGPVPDHIADDAARILAAVVRDRQPVLERVS